MSALGKVVRAGVGRRRLQSLVMMLTALISVAAAVLALGLIETARAPFDRAFGRQHGAHLTAEFSAAKASEAQIRGTARADGVDAAAGPYRVADATLTADTGAASGPQPPGLPEELELPPLTVAGRGDRAPDVDRVGLVKGRWARAPGEIVLEQNEIPEFLSVGSRLQAKELPGKPALKVVGIASSASRTADAWTTPGQLAELDAGRSPAYQMLYRFDDAGSRADIARGRAAVAAAVPKGAVTGGQSYLTVKQDVDSGAAVYVPFLTAFAVIGLGLSVLVVAVAVSGAVTAATGRIGVLKSLGFTPVQVGRAYVAQAVIPAALGVVLGAVAANLLGALLTDEVAATYGTGTQLIPLWVDLAVPAAVLALVAVTALVPALRAGRLRTTQALTVGRAPAAGRGLWVRRLLGRLPLPRPLVLGLAHPFARPARTATLAGAVAFGALAVTFAVGLSSSLQGVQSDRQRTTAGDVLVESGPGNSGPGQHVPAPGSAPGNVPAPKSADPAEVAAAIRDHADTKAYYTIATSPVHIPGVTGETTAIGYRGDSGWGAYRMIEGRWFRGADEVVLASRLLQAMDKDIGDSLPVSDGGRSVRLRIVGEAFVLNNDGMAALMDRTALKRLVPDAVGGEFRVQLEPGSDAAAYATAINRKFAGTTVHATAGDSTAVRSSSIVAMQAMIALLAALLVAVACLGVLNTVVLDTRERLHDLGVFKALGMSPRQTVAMVLVSVAAVGLVAGAPGTFLGVVLHHWVVPDMGASVGTRFPDVFIDVYGAGLLSLLTAGGLVIAALGALLPATWAAKSGTARALRTE
ncbi:FtsX-like permease family protein [Streptomyces boninensis]|uniref:ABC transporter permease n=1 Tax=Streptomyces boninensis TaxID=2039455 RepID=UPI003B21EB08